MNFDRIKFKCLFFLTHSQIEHHQIFNFSRTHNKMMSTLFHVSRPTVNLVKILPLMLVLEMPKHCCSPHTYTETFTATNIHGTILTNTNSIIVIINIPSHGKFVPYKTRTNFQYPIDSVNVDKSFDCEMNTAMRMCM